MHDQLVTDADTFGELCDHVRDQGLAAFDTEFVSEHSYRPQLCLLQVATHERLLTVDPFEVDLGPWWDVVTDEETTVVVHGGQAEIRFCLDATNRPPRKLVDVQLFEGFRSRSYPLSYTNLVQRVLDKSVHGKATRSDWRKRPLSNRQIDYALEDVQHLLPIWEDQEASLNSLGRLEWARAELQAMIEDIAAEREQEPYLKLSGLHKLSRRELGVLRELAAWREAEAERRDRQPRRVLRDDLLIELARRQPKSRGELLETRDMNRGDYRKLVADLLDVIRRGKELDEDELPQKKRGGRRRQHDDEQVIGKLLGIALANRCAEQNVAMSLVGTSEDLRHLVRWHVYGHRKGPPPRLMQGWREEVCGDLLADVLDGRIAIRVADVESDHPLVFERRGDDAGA